jgi:hypothetical protein
MSVSEITKALHLLNQNHSLPFEGMLFQPENCPTILRENPGLLEKQRFASRRRS